MGVWDNAGGGTVHIDQVLTNISIGWPNGEFVGSQLFPTVKVSKQSDLYRIFGREGWVQEPGLDVRSPGTVANEIPGLAVSTNPYYAQEHALQIAVTDEERENADSPLTPDADGTGLVTQKILLGRELAMHTLVTTTGNYASGYSTALGSGTYWDDYVSTTSTPIKDVKTGRNKIHSGLFLEPNVGVFPYQVMSALEDHPDFIDRVKYSQFASITQDIVARLFNIPKLIIPGVGYNSANMGQTASLGYLWGEDVVLAYVPDRPGMKVPAFAYEFCWTFGGQEMVVDRWREDPRASDIIRARRRYDLKFMAVDSSNKSIAGYLIKNTLT